MAKCLILEFQGVGRSEYDDITAKLGIDATTGTGDWPAGMLSHAGGVADDGTLVVTEIWESEDAHHAFMGARLGAVLGAAGMPPPSKTTWVDLFAHHTP